MNKYNLTILNQLLSREFENILFVKKVGVYLSG